MQGPAIIPAHRDGRSYFYWYSLASLSSSLDQPLVSFAPISAVTSLVTQDARFRRSRCSDSRLCGCPGANAHNLNSQVGRGQLLTDLFIYRTSQAVPCTSKRCLSTFPSACPASPPTLIHHVGPPLFETLQPKVVARRVLTLHMQKIARILREANITCPSLPHLSPFHNDRTCTLQLAGSSACGGVSNVVSVIFCDCSAVMVKIIDGGTAAHRTPPVIYF